MYIGIDIGGTSTRIATAENLKRLDIKKTSFTNKHDFEKDFGTLVNTINKFASRPKAIGVGIPGDISLNKKFVRDANHNKEYENRPFIDKLADEFGCRVFMDNDAVVAALGVGLYGEGKDMEDFAYVTWGTGIGGARVKKLEGKISSIKLNWYKYFESWEKKCGGRKLESKFGKSADQLSETEWQKVMEDFLLELKNFLGKISLKNLIFGGGISTKQSPRLMKLVIVETEIKVSSFGEDTGLIGAFALIKNNL